MTALVALSEFALRLEPEAQHASGRMPPEERREVERVLRENQARGRAQRVMEAATLSPEQYVARVVRNWERHGVAWKALKRGDAHVWASLREELRRHASRWLTARGWRLDAAAQDAEEAAQDACIRIRQSSYPFDVPFAAWTGLILKNCLRRRLASSGEVLSHPARLVALTEIAASEALSGLGPSIGEPDGVLDRAALWQAMEERLTRNQREVVLLSFFGGLGGAAVARHMGVTTGAVYSLKHRAIQNLREALRGDPGS